MTDPDGRHISTYDPAAAEQLVAEAADILRALGYAAAHVALIGGLVPGLLVPVLDPGIEPHVGTADIDLCLSVALVEGGTETYERMAQLERRRRCHCRVHEASARSLIGASPALGQRIASSLRCTTWAATNQARRPTLVTYSGRAK